MSIAFALAPGLLVGGRGKHGLKSVSRRPATRNAAVLMTAGATETLVSSSERALNLPWKETVAGDECPLFFMPFIEFQLEQQKKLKNLVDVPFPEELSFQESTKPVAKIESFQWSSDKFRKIRATYIDAGWKAQVFNSVWYPKPEYDLPLLGIDFLSFGKKKVLCVMDFQPLTQDEDYLKKYCERMENVRSKYEGLSGKMSARFYDEALFFSKQLIFAKFDTQEPIESQLLPAFKDYVEEYMTMMDNAVPDTSDEGIKKVTEWQREYDQYSAERDPAVGLFSTYWGKEWADKFTHDFLFSDSVPVEKS